MTKFSVNLNKIALLRNSRGHNLPDVSAFGRRCLTAGAHGLTIHPRPDQRHARYDDVLALKAVVAQWPQAELNIEGNPQDRFLDVVLAARPHQCTLVPDADNQLTSDHGWDAIAQQARLRTVVAALRAAGIRSSLFLDPVLEQVDAAAATGADRIELYTEPYAQAFGGAGQASMLATYAAAANRAHALGLGVNAGHDLNLENLGPFLAAVPGIDEVSIGHAVICESLDFGLEPTVGRYLSIVGVAPRLLR